MKNKCILLLLNLCLSHLIAMNIHATPEIPSHPPHSRELFRIPVFDAHGIVAELLSLESCDDQTKPVCEQSIILSPAPNQLEPDQLERAISDFPIFDSFTESLEISFTNATDSNPTYYVNLKNQNHSKQYSLPKQDIPTLPKNTAHIIPTVLALRPQMLNDFNTDASKLWSFLNKISFSSELSEEIISVTSFDREENDREESASWINFDMGDDFAMSLKLDYDNQPQVVFIDDEQGRYLRATLNTIDTLAAAGNAAEIYTHSYKISDYWGKLTKSDTWFHKNSAYLFHNVAELTEHTAHLSWTAYQRLPTFITGLSNQLGDWTYNQLPSPPAWVWGIPPFALVLLDRYNIVCTGKEFYDELYDEKMIVAINTFSVIVGIYNLIKSNKPAFIYKRNAERIKPDA